MQMPMATFGRTGHVSSRVIFGGAALADVTQAVADRALDVLLEYGVNHIDVAAGYGDAELRFAVDQHGRRPAGHGSPARASAIV